LVRRCKERGTGISPGWTDALSIAGLPVTDILAELDSATVRGRLEFGIVEGHHTSQLLTQISLVPVWLARFPRKVAFVFVIYGGLRARRVAEQDSPGDRPSKARESRKGGIAMVKKVLGISGSRMRTALVVLGWISFLVGLAVKQPAFSIPLRAIARVLP